MVIINELSLRTHIDGRSLVDFLASVLSLNTDLIGNELEFWDRLSTSTQLSVGMSVHWAATGFQTYLKWYQTAELSQLGLLRIAAKASSHFVTDVAIGNFIDSPEVSIDRFLVVTPNGKLYRAFATSNSDVFELQPEGPSIAFSEAIKQLS